MQQGRHKRGSKADKNREIPSDEAKHLPSNPKHEASRLASPFSPTLFATSTRILAKERRTEEEGKSKKEEAAGGSAPTQTSRPSSLATSRGQRQPL